MKKLVNILGIVAVILILLMEVIDYNRSRRSHNDRSYYEWLQLYADSDSSIYYQKINYEAAINIKDSI